MKNENARVWLGVCVAVVLAACSPEDAAQLSRGPGGDTSDPAAAAPPGDASGHGPDPATCRASAQEYIGFGKGNLAASRVDERAGANRARVKPARALRGDLARVTGAAPTGETEGPASRMFVEPEATAMSVGTGFSNMFEVGLGIASRDPALNAAPSDASATTFCKGLITSAWLREATEAEVAACKAVALEDTAQEPDAKKRWAYAAAAVLSSAAFVSY